MLSIHTSVFNLFKTRLPWQEAVTNWFAFCRTLKKDHGLDSEIIFAVNKGDEGDYTRNDIDVLCGSLNGSNQKTPISYTIIDTAFDYSDPAFDGKIKNEGYQAAVHPLCMLLDLDEFLPLNKVDVWARVMEEFNSSFEQFKGLLIPSIDTFLNRSNARSVGQKWYLVRNEKNVIGRGVVGFAKLPDGKIDITKSDTTEPIFLRDSSLIPSGFVMNPNLDIGEKLQKIFTDKLPFVIHRGWEDIEARIIQNKIWAPVWENRAGKSVEPPLVHKKDFQSIDHVTIPFVYNI